MLSGGGFWLRDLQYPHSVRSEDTVDPGSVARGPYVTPGLLNDRPASLRHLSVAHGRCGCRAENNNVTKRPNGGRARGRYVTPGRLINHCVAVRSGRNVCFLLPVGHARLFKRSIVEVKRPAAAAQTIAKWIHHEATVWWGGSPRAACQLEWECA